MKVISSSLVLSLMLGFFALFFNKTDIAFGKKTTCDYLVDSIYGSHFEDTVICSIKIPNPHKLEGVCISELQVQNVRTSYRGFLWQQIQGYLFLSGGKRYTGQIHGSYSANIFVFEGAVENGRPIGTWLVDGIDYLDALYQITFEYDLTQDKSVIKNLTFVASDKLDLLNRTKYYEDKEYRLFIDSRDTLETDEAFVRNKWDSFDQKIAVDSGWFSPDQGGGLSYVRVSKDSVRLETQSLGEDKKLWAYYNRKQKLFLSNSNYYPELLSGNPSYQMSKPMKTWFSDPNYYIDDEIHSYEYMGDTLIGFLSIKLDIKPFPSLVLSKKTYLKFVRGQQLPRNQFVEWLGDKYGDTITAPEIILDTLNVDVKNYLD